MPFSAEPFVGNLPPIGGKMPAAQAGTASMNDALENAKWGALVESLPQAFYDRALLLGARLRQEVTKISEHCGRLLTLQFGTRVDRKSVQEAILSLSPDGGARSTDLLIIADMLGCGGADDIGRLAALTARALPRGGHCALLHWTDGSLCGASGEAGAEEFVRLAQPRLQPLLRRRTPEFRLDILERA